MSEHEDQWIEEEELAARAGVTREFLKKMRAEQPPGTTGRADNKAIIWQKNAARNALVAFGVPFELDPPPEPIRARVVLPERVTVIYCPVNRHIVICQRAGGQRVNVRVVDNRKYCPKLATGEPMTLEAIQNPVGSWWNLVGREPRWSGRW